MDRIRAGSKALWFDGDLVSVCWLSAVMRIP